MKYFLMIVFMISRFANAQLLDETALDTVKVYKSIEEAMVNPDEVYILKLKGDKLTEFPKEILKFKNLNKLELNKNKLTNIPEKINELKYLQHLNLAKNAFTKLPKSVCELTNLKELVLNNNYIEGFPAEIEKLKKLEYLDCWSNELEYFPTSMAKLVNLKELDLREINIPDKKQAVLRGMLPNTKVHFSTSCGCE